MPSEEGQFSEYVKALDVIRDRMIKAGLIARHGYRDDPKLVGSEFTPDGQEVVTTIYTLHHAIGPLTSKQIILFWGYMVEVAEQRKGDRRTR